MTDFTIARMLDVLPTNPIIKVQNPIQWVAAHTIAKRSLWLINSNYGFTHETTSSYQYTQMGEEVQKILNQVIEEDYQLQTIKLGTGRAQAFDNGGLLYHHLRNYDLSAMRWYRNFVNNQPIDVGVSLIGLIQAFEVFKPDHVNKLFKSWCTEKGAIYEGQYFWSAGSLARYMIKRLPAQRQGQCYESLSRMYDGESISFEIDNIEFYGSDGRPKITNK